MIFVGSLISSPLSECIGRKRCLILVNLLQSGSCFIMLVGLNFPILLTGWLLNGFSAGLGRMPAYTLTSEISTIRLRGVLAILNSICKSYGQLLLYVVNILVPPEYLLLVGITLSLSFLLLSPFIVRSPHWLLRNGKMIEAEEMLRLVRGPNYSGVEEELINILSVITKQNNACKSCIGRWTSSDFLLPFGIIVALFGSIGLVGRDVPVNFYGPSMFAEFGFLIPFETIMILIPCGSAFGYTASLFIARQLKKKSQFLLGASIMIVSSGLISISYLIKKTSCDESYYVLLSKIFFMIGVFGITLGFGAGYGSVVYTLPGELLAPEDKSIGGAAGEGSRMIVTAIALKVYPHILAVLGFPLLFFTHVFATILSAIFVSKFLPDTDNKSLSEIQALLKKS
ncbi:uncharacterized protein LOC111699642 isoform X1 [Eurytemora carolleeae]|uniref:uncharacterized protein LOC111699642 isoform X1 n=1 Tax=Eurytemora carolleeae TaxID=1294199 RepID=UPI000C7861BF|nr:uncharacterized protein LOC111699642 isoform X1 [Eurytemora carolleeae]|eukprot:XP_023326131.1 uncharacterized protein LOC111699642 isoform X1 [Eurytemora affinis]